MRHSVNTTVRTLSVTLIASMLIFSSAASYAEKVFRVCVGSYSTLENARNALDAANTSLGDGFEVARADSASGTLYRILSQPYESRLDAEKAVASARRAEISGAWIVASRRQEPVDAAPTPVFTPPSSNRLNTLRSNTLPPRPAAPTGDTAKTVALNGAAGVPVQLAEQRSSASTNHAIRIIKTDESAAGITIDGRLNESIWSNLPNVGKFVVLEPDTLADVPHATNIKLAYTDKGLYVGADLEQPKDTLIRRLSGRDVFFGLNRDSINLTLDTSGEGLYGFWFGINLGDSLMDGTVLPEYRYSNEWDGPWRGASTETDTGWSAEFFIPWSAISMPSAGDVRNMGIYMSRKVAYLDERWGWPALPNTQPKFLSVLQPVELKGIAPRQQYNIYPFAAVTRDGIDDETRYQVGADLFWRPSSNFQLNATLNPDFGNVESDDVDVNLSATETFFPEKRLFFVEGQEIFVASPRADTRSSGVGNSGPPTTLVNTRRIGGRPQSPTLQLGQTISAREVGLPAELFGAAKGTGQISNFRYGVLAAFEDEVTFKAAQNGQDLRVTQDGSDYGIARLLYENNDDGYRALGLLSTAVQHYDRDAYVTGIDWHLLTGSGKLKMDGQVFRSDLDNVDVGYGGFVDFEYTFRRGVKQRLGIEYFDDDVNINDLGFQSRNNYRQIRTAHTRTTSDLSWARNNQFDVRAALMETGDGLLGRGGIFFANRTTFNNLTSLTLRLEHFLPSYDDLNGFGNGTFRTAEKTGGGIKFESNSTKALSYSLGAGYFEEDLGGDSFNYDASIDWRPVDGLNLSAGLSYFDYDGWLLHQEGRNMTTFDGEGLEPYLTLEYFLSAKQQFKLSVQWVGIEAIEDEFYRIPDSAGRLVPTVKPDAESDSFSISDLVFQARYRWEIAPLSDLYIVYIRAADVTRPLGRDDYSDFLDRAWAQPIADQLVMKIRYRFGS
ncbi:DUF5916 domain-containing protein [Gammaproteobacteria bacterium]|nr:DUF5916 domain-containing protein [Gammaproteobacteria bacterium]